MLPLRLWQIPLQSRALQESGKRYSGLAWSRLRPTRRSASCESAFLSPRSDTSRDLFADQDGSASVRYFRHARRELGIRARCPERALQCSCLRIRWTRRSRRTPCIRRIQLLRPGSRFAHVGVCTVAAGLSFEEEGATLRS